jgi:hypothetical protein
MSRFSRLYNTLLQPAPIERERTRAERDQERRQIREDMEFGRRSGRQQAADADPNAAYEAHCKAQALRIIQAGARARGLPVPVCLEQDRDDAPGPGDDTTDQPKKSKKRAKPAVADDDEDADADEPKDRGDEDNDTNNDERKHKAIALQIINAGRRARNLPLLAKLDQDR